MNACEIASRVRSGECSMREIAEEYLKRSQELNSKFNALVYLDPEDILKQIENQQARLERGHVLPLAGVPIAVKDNICVAGIPTTCSSKILQGFRSSYDATVIRRLRDAGAIIFAKANCDEFGMGSSSENSFFGPVRNPWDESRVPGGSSGGSAAAVAADLVPIALGSDTGGSVRQPASYCGLVGLKPTYGRVSRYGLVAYASSLDTIGPIARTADDAALVMSVIEGYDQLDSTSVSSEPCFIDSRLKGLRIGLPKEWFASGINFEVRQSIEAAIKVLQESGLDVKEVSLPNIRFSLPTYYLIATAEASSNLARYDGVRFGFRKEMPNASLKEMYKTTRSTGFSREVKQRIMLGTFALSSGFYDAYFARATRARAIISRDFDRAFSDVDVLLSPTAPTTAFKLGEMNSDPISMYLQDIFTVALNLVGIPGISVPCGFDKSGLPIGMQIVGPKFSESLLLGLARAFQQKTLWHERRP